MVSKSPFSNVKCSQESGHPDLQSVLMIKGGIFASQAFMIRPPQTLGLRPLDLSGLTAPSIGYNAGGQRQSTNEITESFDDLASVSLVTHTADIVIGVRKYYLTSKQLGKVSFT